MSSLHGLNIIAGEVRGAGQDEFHAIDPRSGEKLEPRFVEATSSDVGAAGIAAAAAFSHLHTVTDAERSAFLDSVADEIDAIRQLIIERASLETGKPPGALAAELDRCIRICRSFAKIILTDEWCKIQVDQGVPEDVQRPDMRRISIPVGPIAVFGASNIPLMGSACGTDAIAALAAGCPVIVKGHPAHPGTSELLATAVTSAIAMHDKIPLGMYSLVQGGSTAMALNLVELTEVSGVAFTGSLRAGRAIHDAAARRDRPIPVFGEMGSLNPIFVLPDAARADGDQFATALGGAVVRHSGQLCTKPGVVFVPDSEAGRTLAMKSAEVVGEFEASPLLHDGILAELGSQLGAMSQTAGVARLAPLTGDPIDGRVVAGSVFQCSAEVFLANEHLRREVFGPTTLFVTYDGPEQLGEIVGSFEGELTGTIWGTRAEIAAVETISVQLRTRVGRVLWRSMPTGTPDLAAMHHGGPYPASTNAQHSSIGPSTIEKYLRPVVYQNFPEEVLPLRLRG